MEETQDPKASTEGGTPERDAEATSSETLSDIEANEKVSTGGSGSSTGSDLEGSSPKPDTGGEGRADGSDTGGPM
ncbi:MAG TPA: hypothetical protein VN282_01675 [Pyrinomonadaceae bacterium]|nr:hypothetical protein [Pyrinomonadaceae bacterium]